jgi:hypothetical protein
MISTQMISSIPTPSPLTYSGVHGNPKLINQLRGDFGVAPPMPSDGSREAPGTITISGG